MCCQYAGVSSCLPNHKRRAVGVQAFAVAEPKLRNRRFGNRIARFIHHAAVNAPFTGAGRLTKNNSELKQQPIRIIFLVMLRLAPVRFTVAGGRGRHCPGRF